MAPGPQGDASTVKIKIASESKRASIVSDTKSRHVMLVTPTLHNIIFNNLFFFGGGVFTEFTIVVNHA